ncbi:molybdopterin molybdenumtransferase MoeA [Alteromonas sediminis]|uniref:Molybdopterin molybdenumtransferase n=1 Tax=Alteromonas sediminis TaxID=2259342 RepID=A0A3N5Y2B6_9ALTE|nr:gephyrin-like molybdotransferase Glp [Alteromonas sediminis]RPJ67480.1 molybdopterin molybdenumtransferase MoeA [Alteromonas sediminis]
MSGWLSLDEALSQALSHITPVTQSEVVSLYEAMDRVLATDIQAPVNVPPWDNSAMDGYAIYVDDATTQERAIIGSIAAGDAVNINVDATTCVRIMTGAAIPPGANAVVIQENTERDGDNIVFTKPCHAGDNIRPCANDIAKGSKVLSAGHALTSADLVLISSLGIAAVEVVRKLNVALVATGSELVLPGQPLPNEGIYESHRAGLIAKLSAMQCNVTDAGIVKDEPDQLRQVFADLALTHDLVISSGGVSVGDADWVKPTLNQLGTLHLWKVAIKPGKPFAFGQFGECYFCGLPGNPVSAFVTFEQLASPILQKLSGQHVKQRLTIPARLTHNHTRRPGRLDFARANFTKNEAGLIEVTLHQKQSSGVMTSITQANCFALLPAGQAVFQKGETVQIQPFSIVN